MGNVKIRNLIFVGLLALVVGYFVYQNLGFSSIPAPPSRSTTPKGLQELQNIPSIQIAHLENVSRLQKGASRNLFRFGEKPLPVQQLPPKPTPPKPVVTPPIIQPQPTVKQELQGRGPGPTPEVDFTFLGYFGPQDTPFIVFLKENEIAVVQKGEIFFEEYHVLNIGYESVEIGFQTHPGTKHLPLGG